MGTASAAPKLTRVAHEVQILLAQIHRLAAPQPGMTHQHKQQPIAPTARHAHQRVELLARDRHDVARHVRPQHVPRSQREPPRATLREPTQRDRQEEIWQASRLAREAGARGDWQMAAAWNRAQQQEILAALAEP